MLLTIFTPTYNRARTLERIFRSLCSQSSADFEWIIVDDGSTDDTETVVKSFYNDRFCIRYIKSDHGGKHRAYNKALDLACGEYLFIVDSDDWLPKKTLEIIEAELKNVDAGKKIAGLIGLRSNPAGFVYGKRFPCDKLVVTLRGLELAHCMGERAFIINTDVAKSCPFPEFGGEYFVTESVVFDRIGRQWQFIAVDKVLTIGEYLPDGLSRNIFRLMWENPIGYMLYHSQRIDASDNWAEAMKYGLRYNSFKCIAKKGGSSKPCPTRYKGLIKLLSPIGLIGKIYYGLNRLCH